jgi:hypothetical protein
MFTLYIGKTDKEDQITREIYSLFQAFTRIGGFTTFIF